MRLDPKLIHPSIHKAANAWAWSGKGTAGHPNAQSYYSVSLQKYGPGCLLYGFVSLALFIGTGLLMVAHEVDKPIRVFTMIGLMIGLMGLGFWGLASAAKRVSAAELEAVLPVLSLSETERAYAETVVAIHRMDGGSTVGIETIQALNALLDEEARLILARGQAVGLESADTALRFESERNALRQKVERTADPEAQDAYRQSLSLLDERIAAYRSAAASVERIDAHLSLLRQAVLATRDASRRLNASPADPASALATDSLRSAVALARAQTSATERAIAELNAL